MSDPQIKRKWLKYSWRVCVGLVSLFVVLLVFNAIYDRQIQTTVAIGGLLYCTIRSIALGQAIGSTSIFFGIAQDLEEIKARLAGIEVDRIARELAEENIRHLTVKMVIDGGFVAITTLICFVQLMKAI